MINQIIKSWWAWTPSATTHREAVGENVGSILLEDMGFGMTVIKTEPHINSFPPFLSLHLPSALH